MGSRNTLKFALAAALISAPLLPRAALAEIKCAGTLAPQIFHAATAPDGSMIVTREGEIIRLAGIAVPGELDRDADANGRAAKTLNALVAGKKISVSAQSGAKDRYGRIVAQVELVDESKWIQAELIAAGVARVAPQFDVGQCTLALLKIEREAIKEKAGLWSEPRFAVQQASDITELSDAEGRYMVVEGRVRRVGESAGRVYLDFGGRFNEDFSVIVPREANKAFTNAGIDLRSLEGIRLRVRGIVSMRGGPAIELFDPSAMELLKDGV